MVIREIVPPPHPRAVLEHLPADTTAALLESAAGPSDETRYSIVACDPFALLSARGLRGEVRAPGGALLRRGDPIVLLEDLLTSCEPDPDVPPLPFTGGAIGALGFDLAPLLEPGLPHRRAGIPTCAFAFYDGAYLLDHREGRGFLVSSGCPAAGTLRRARARSRVDELAALLLPRGLPLSVRPAPRHPLPLGPLRSSLPWPSYRRAVQAVREEIARGEVYQVNLTQQLTGPLHADPLALYRTVVAHHPTPFSAFIRLGTLSIVSNSPELFLRCSPRDRRIETRPIKGTRPRGHSPAEDRRLREELLADAKERAEHVMIVDLERNDLGRVCEAGSVKVARLAEVRSYGTVHHLVSVVQGHLRGDAGLRELLRATFPGGSISGAPKIRALEIIRALEPVPRGIYTGALGYFDRSGALDLAIAIRTAVVRRGVLTLGVGGGIVWDSEPEREYRECRLKSAAFLLSGRPARGDRRPARSVPL